VMVCVKFRSESSSLGSVPIDFCDRLFFCSSSPDALFVSRSYDRSPSDAV
jgi:hypothetical protein